MIKPFVKGCGILSTVAQNQPWPYKLVFVCAFSNTDNTFSLEYADVINEVAISKTPQKLLLILPPNSVYNIIFQFLEAV